MSAFNPLRSCFRCGSEFRLEAGSRICPTCRTPKPLINKAVNLSLSFREKQVVDLVAQAKLNKQIAFDLHLTEGTIKEYLNRIYRKLGVTNRTELAVWAVTKRASQPPEQCEKRETAPMVLRSVLPNRPQSNPASAGRRLGKSLAERTFTM
jgi:DNA-binding CsgD family transcriptional regulator